MCTGVHRTIYLLAARDRAICIFTVWLISLYCAHCHMAACLIACLEACGIPCLRDCMRGCGRTYKREPCLRAVHARAVLWEKESYPWTCFDLWKTLSFWKLSLTDCRKSVEALILTVMSPTYLSNCLLYYDDNHHHQYYYNCLHCHHHHQPGRQCILIQPQSVRSGL